MSQAEELLASLSEEDISAYTADQSTEEHIVIGDNRIITVPSSLKRIAVQHDNNIETVTFDCPRYWDEHDMSKMKVYINYLRADRKPGCYPIDTGVTIDAENDRIMHFNWTISNNVTEVHGKIVFLVCIKTVDEVGNEAEHWNSELCTDMYVSEGLETQETVVEKYPDLITHLLTRMDIVEDKTTLESMLGYLDTYFTTDAEINEVLKNYVETYLKTDDAVTQKIADTVNAYIEEHLSATDKTLTVSEMPADAAATGDAVRNMVNVSNDILIDDSVEGVLNFKKIYGRSEQVKTSGKNLANINTSGNNVNIGDARAGKSYTLCFVQDSATDFNLFIGIGTTNEHKLTTNKINTGTNAIVNFTPEKSGVLHFNGFSTVNQRDFMLVEGTFSEFIPYEPYTGGMAAPNPEYPQEINSAGDGGAIEGEIYSGNLLDMGEVYSKLGTNTEITMSYSNGKLTMTGTPTASYRQNTTGRKGLMLPKGVAGKTLYFGATLSGNQPYVVLYFRDVDGNQLDGGSGITSSGVRELLVPENAVYYEFAFCLNMATTGSAYTATFSDLYLSTANNGYTEYADPKSITIPTPNGLPGIEVDDASIATYTDPDGKTWVCDEIDVERGVYVQRINHIRLLSTMTWSSAGGTTNYRYWTVNNDFAGQIQPVRCSHLTLAASWSEHMNNTSPSVYLYKDSAWNDGRLSFATQMATNDEWIAFLDANDVYVDYPLATPIETPLTRDQILAFRNYSSHDGGTNILFDPVEPGVEVEYPRTLAASHTLQNQKDVADLKTPIREVTAVGDITIDDSVAGGLRVTKMVGKSVQETVAGNQLLDVDSAQIGVAFHLGANDARAVIYVPCKPSTAYTITMDLSGFELVTWFEKVAESDVATNANVTLTNATTTFTTADSTNFICIQFNKEGITLADIESANIMLNSGSTALPWEPFVGGIPSPNPSYPQPIVSVGEKLAMGKNLYNNATSTNQGLSDDGTISNNNQRVLSDFIGVSAMAYTLTFPSSICCFIGYGVYDSAKNFLSRVMLDDLSGRVSFTPTQNGYIRLMFRGVDEYSDNVPLSVLSEIMLNSGSTALPWEPYTGGKKAAFDVGIGNDICGKNICKPFFEAQYNVHKTPKIRIEANTDYCVSAKYNAVLGTNPHFYVVASNGESLIATAFTSDISKVFNTGNNTEIYLQVNNGDSASSMSDTIEYLNSVTMLRLASVEDDTYSPYTGQSHTLNRKLKAIPVTDSTLANYTDESGQMWCADTIEEVGGKMCLVERVSHKKLTKDLSMSKSTTTAIDRYLVVVNDIATPNIYAGYCSHAWLKSDSNAYLNSFRYDINDGNTRFAIDYAEAGTTDLDTFKTFLDENDVYAVYILATPVITELTNDEIVALRSLKTYHGITHIFTDNNPTGELTVSYGATELGGLALENKNLHEVNEALDSQLEEKVEENKELITAINSALPYQIVIDDTAGTINFIDR